MTILLFRAQRMSLTIWVLVLLFSPISESANVNDKATARPVYLNIIWHQHQPSYVNPETDQLQGPWVRTHATKDYYDMAAILLTYPNVHCNINLTSSLLHQVQEYYVKRLGPYVDVKRNSLDVAGFLQAWRGKTDPWIDLVLKNTDEFDSLDEGFLFRNVWNAFGMSEVMIERFPEYLALKEKALSSSAGGKNPFSIQEMREIKFWFYLANFDPDFFRGGVTLVDGSVCDLSEYLEERQGKFYLRKEIREEDCSRIIAEVYKVVSQIIPVHKRLQYDPISNKGQVEIITTPFYHPILPLLIDSDIARVCQPQDSMPKRFAFPEDARAQVAMSVAMYKDVFGRNPTGMWPAEGSISQDAIRVFRESGIRWIAGDVKVLSKSSPENQHNSTIFAFPSDPERDAWMSVVFRDTELSDRIGFTYQDYDGEVAAQDFVDRVLSFDLGEAKEEVLLTVILDGENAWEWYRKTVDGKEFLHALYQKLSKLYETGRVITTTTIEYIEGNPSRGIQPHPITRQKKMEWLFPGSWINGNYDTWIGEAEENKAWEYLLKTRLALSTSGIPAPAPGIREPESNTKAWFEWKAWHSMYAAEGSDWFWWYGDDQQAPAGDTPFDDAFRLHLENVYTFARLAGSGISSPGFEPILDEKPRQRTGQGTMATGDRKNQQVLFLCDARGVEVADAIYIAGNIEQLGNWTPNRVRMFDDGTHGDDKQGDGIWSLLISVQAGSELLYKFTNSGEVGRWVPGEEFAAQNRRFTLHRSEGQVVIIENKFGMHAINE